MHYRNYCLPALGAALAASLFLPSAFAASMYVTSNAAYDPGQTVCTLASPCHIDRAFQLAATNGRNDEVILAGPSTFVGARQYFYNPAASDLDRDFKITVAGGAGLFDGNGGELVLAMKSRNGNLSVQGIEIVNSTTAYQENSWNPGEPAWNSALSFDVSGDGDIGIDDVSIWLINRKVYAGGDIHPGAAGVHARTDGGRLDVSNSLFVGNNPGALRATAAHVKLDNNDFLSNRSASQGIPAQGAVYLEAETVAVEHNNFSGNRCTELRYAGGLSVRLARDIPVNGIVNSRVADNQFLNNDGWKCAGGLLVDRDPIPDFISRIEIDNNQFARNSIMNAGGGGIAINAARKSRFLVRNNVMYDNEAVDDAGTGWLAGPAMHATIRGDSDLYFLGNTITNNSLAYINSGAVHILGFDHGTVIEVANNIIWGNPTTVQPFADSDLYVNGHVNGSTTVRYNDYCVGVTYNASVSNNICTAPGFVDAAGDNYHLAPNSDLIDAGSTSPSYLPPVDFDGQARVQGAGIDIGADEFSGVARRQVTLNKLGNGTGSVSTMPSGLACGVGCASNSAYFDHGSTIGFMAAASADSTFAGWGGDCSGTAPGTQIVVDGQKTCTAEFQLRRHRIVINASGSGLGSISSDYGPPLNWSYPLGGTQRVVDDIVPGADVTITASVNDPMQDHVFFETCGSLGGVVTGQYTGTATCTLQDIQQDYVISVKLDYGVVLFPGRTLSISRTGSGNGTVTSVPTGIDCGPTCSSTFAFESDVKLTAVPDGHSLFVGWGGDCPAGNGDATVKMDNNRSCTAEFITAYNIDVTLQGNGSGAFTDVYRGMSTVFPNWSTHYSARYPENAGALRFEVNSTDSTITISGCTDAAQGMVVTGNGTMSASCDIASPNKDNSLTVTYTRGNAQDSLFSDRFEQP